MCSWGYYEFFEEEKHVKMSWIEQGYMVVTIFIVLFYLQIKRAWHKFFMYLSMMYNFMKNQWSVQVVFTVPGCQKWNNFSKFEDDLCVQTYWSTVIIIITNIDYSSS